MANVFHSEVDRLIDRLHSRERLRVWSIVMTVFGDAVVPRGGTLWLGSLQALMDRLRIDAGTLRAAMSRLTADGWLTRSRIGRKSFYRLADAGGDEFTAATRRIYAPCHTDWSGEWHIYVLNEQSDSRTGANREKLRQAGFRQLDGRVFIRPKDGDADYIVSGDDMLFKARIADIRDLESFVGRLWQLDEARRFYSRFIEDFSPLEAQILNDTDADLDPLDAIAARILLIHDYRRAVLRDPLLPPQLLPGEWPAASSRVLAARIYTRLAKASEDWLDRNGADEQGMLPLANINIAERFVEN